MKKVAHQPHINLKMREKLVTPRSYQEGMAKMMHFIDAAKNHSKFYEMAIVPGGNGTFTLVRMWGALTDLSGGGMDPRVSTKIQENLSLPEAQAEMRKITAEKLGKGYKDTFRENRGQYPIGLTREVGFGWGTQEATKAPSVIPALRTLLYKLDSAIDAGESMDQEGMAVSLAEVSRILFDMPASSMAKELQRKLSTPAKQLLSGEVNPRLLSRALKTVRNYIENQLSAIGRTASARAVLIKLASSLPLLKTADDTTPMGQAEDLVNHIKSGINTPYLKTAIYTLGGQDRPSVGVDISLDPKPEWKNGIFENSRYGKFMINVQESYIELLSRYGVEKFRKTKFRNANDAVAKLNNWVSLHSNIHSLTASDRSVLVKLASSLPAGSSERRAILASLEVEIKKDADPKSHDQNKPETWMGLK